MKIVLIEKGTETNHSSMRYVFDCDIVPSKGTSIKISHKHWVKINSEPTHVGDSHRFTCMRYTGPLNEELYSPEFNTRLPQDFIELQLALYNGTFAHLSDGVVMESSNVDYSPSSVHFFSNVEFRVSGNGFKNDYHKLKLVPLSDEWLLYWNSRMVTRQDTITECIRYFKGMVNPKSETTAVCL